MENEIKQLAEILGDSSSHVIAEYTKWYFINGIVWTLLWVSLLVATVRIKPSADYDEEIVTIVRYVMAIIFALGIATCVTNIIAPEAYAIHGLIVDIKS
jgi:hypothetical protein